MATRLHYNDLAKVLFGVFTQEQDGDIIMGYDCLRMGLYALYCGTGGVTRTELDKKQFGKLFASQPRSSSASAAAAAIALLSREDVKDIKQQFVTEIIDNCTQFFLHSRIVRDEVDTHEKRLSIANNVNKWFEMKSDGFIKCIVNAGIMDMYKRGAMSMVILSQFLGIWEYPFVDGMMKSMFFQSGSMIEVDMMTNTTNEYTLVNCIMEKKLEATIVKFPYANEFGAFIAVMPDKPADKDKLSTLLQCLELETLFDSFEKVSCCSQSMPKFNTETQITLNEGMGRVESLKVLTSETVDFSNMFEGGIPHDYMTFKLKSTIENTEYGTKVIARMDVDVFDGMLEGRNICLNKPFLYFIVNPENYIFAMGMFLGE